MTGGFREFIQEGFGFRTEMEERSKRAVKSFLLSIAKQSYEMGKKDK